MLRNLRPLFVILLAALFVVGCIKVNVRMRDPSIAFSKLIAVKIRTLAPTPTPNQTATRMPRPRQTLVPTIQLRLRIVSSSDHTTVRLPDNLRLVRQQTVFFKGLLSNKNLEGQAIYLAQTMERAKEGRSFEIIQDIALQVRDRSQELSFLVEKGSLGETSVEVFNLLTDEPTLVDRFIFDGFEGLPKEFFVVDVKILTTKTPSAPHWIPVRIKMTSTSDWTEYHLVPDIKIAQRQEVEKKGNIIAEVIAGRLANIQQSQENAAAGQTIELVQDFMLTDFADEQVLTFTIEKGCFGETTIEVFQFLAGFPILVGRAATKNCKIEKFSVNLKNFP